jgi:hypothetical protein
MAAEIFLKATYAIILQYPVGYCCGNPTDDSFMSKAISYSGAVMKAL